MPRDGLDQGHHLPLDGGLWRSNTASQAWCRVSYCEVRSPPQEVLSNTAPRSGWGKRVNAKSKSPGLSFLYVSS